MRYLLLALLVAVQVTQDPPREQYPGQSQHAEPPKDWFCMPQNYTLTVPPDHACNCERSCDETTGKIREDQKCGSFCHADHCKCEVSNKAMCH